MLILVVKDYQTLTCFLEDIAQSFLHSYIPKTSPKQLPKCWISTRRNIIISIQRKQNATAMQRPVSSSLA